MLFWGTQQFHGDIRVGKHCRSAFARGNHPLGIPLPLQFSSEHRLWLLASIVPEIHSSQLQEKYRSHVDAKTPARALFIQRSWYKQPSLSPSPFRFLKNKGFYRRGGFLASVNGESDNRSLRLDHELCLKEKGEL